MSWCCKTMFIKPHSWLLRLRSARYHLKQREPRNNVLIKSHETIRSFPCPRNRWSCLPLEKYKRNTVWKKKQTEKTIPVSHICQQPDVFSNLQLNGILPEEGPIHCQGPIHSPPKNFFFFSDSFIYERKRVGVGAEGERLMQTLYWARKRGGRAQSHDSEIMTWAKTRGHLTSCATQVPPSRTCTFSDRIRATLWSHTRHHQEVKAVSPRCKGWGQQRVSQQECLLVLLPSWFSCQTSCIALLQLVHQLFGNNYRISSMPNKSQHSEYGFLLLLCDCAQ